MLTVWALLAAVSVAPATAQTSDEEIGAEVAKQVETEIGLYQAPVAAEYFEAIGMRLVGNLKNNPYTFKFHIVDQFSPNAFAVPGGWVYVSRGLLVLANTEDELAGVIGHEITHVAERHSAHRQRRGMFGAVLQIPGNVVGAVVGEDLGNLLNAPIKTIGQVSLATYSRGQETEADRVGMRLAAGSGYDPLALADILDQLEAEVEMLTGEQCKASFFDSHPTTPDRVEKINNEARKIDWSPQAPIVHMAEAHRAREPRVLDPDPFIAQSTGDTLDHPVTAQTISVLNFGLGLKEHLSESIQAFFGFHTDFSPADDQTADDVYLTKWNLYHLTGGTQFMLWRAQFTLGLG